MCHILIKEMLKITFKKDSENIKTNKLDVAIKKITYVRETTFKFRIRYKICNLCYGDILI